MIICVASCFMALLLFSLCIFSILTTSKSHFHTKNTSASRSLSVLAPKDLATCTCTSFLRVTFASRSSFSSWSATSFSRSTSNILMPFETSRQAERTMPFSTGPFAAPRKPAYFVRWTSCFWSSFSTCFSKRPISALCLRAISTWVRQALSTDVCLPLDSPKKKRVIESATLCRFRFVVLLVSLSRRQSAKTVLKMPWESPPNHFLMSNSDAA
mmetsp:Transcript_74631/g.209433  ORF Transcript_74631/g.209433 Transcript_74631/m.209433 type:complete len:213 (-) Transcript_74631:1806-2444(-)